jgi:hypothetical protein
MTEYKTDNYTIRYAADADISYAWWEVVDKKGNVVNEFSGLYPAKEWAEGRDWSNG